MHTVLIETVRTQIMLTTPALISLLYFSAFILYPLLGIYIYSLNSKAEINQIFLAMSLFLGIWALGFSFAVNAPNYEQALHWRRFSSLGWGSAYAIQLHFSLALSGNTLMLNKKWFRPLLYLPALISILAFGPFTIFANDNYLLEWTHNGWVSLYINTVWDWIFNFYYVSYSIASIIVYIVWSRRSKEETKRRTARLVGISFLGIILLGTLVDVLEQGEEVIPDISVIIIVLPLAALYYSIKKHGIMIPKKTYSTADAGEILDEAKRRDLYKYISAAFVIGAILNWGHYIFYNADIIDVLSYSALLYVIALLFRLIPQMSLSRRRQDDLIVALLAVSIPLIMLHYLNDYASNIVWPVPIIFMSLGAIYSKRRMIIAASASAVITQVYSWIKAPYMTVQITHVDHVLRLIFFILGAVLSLYINRVYVFRLNENDKQIRFQNMISHISTGLIRVNKSEIDQKFTETLGLCGQYFQADRSYLFMIAKKTRSMSCKYYWHNTTAADAPELVSDMVADTIFHLASKQVSYEPMRVNSLESLANSRGEIQHILSQLGTKSLMVIPLMSKTSIIGFWWLDTLNQDKTWTDDHAKQLGVIANILADTLIKVDAEKEIYQMALYDELTGLPNRALFNSHMEKALSLAERSNELIAIMFVDLDSFKQINDTMGHNFGDQILKQAADRLSSGTRKYDTVSRFGGDEFLIMLPQMSDPEQIKQAANKIMSTFNEPIHLKDQEIFLTASAGIAIYPFDGKNIETLIKSADLAMYSAKERGKNRYSFYSDLMETSLQKNVHLTNQLHRALERGELILYYQPQVSIETNRIIGNEALLRWQHPSMGMISPTVFIPLAENSGLINKIGLWVLRTACRQNKKWQHQGAANLRISVNVSVEQLRSRDFVAKTAAVLKETGLAPEYLELEITESVFTRDPDQITEVLDKLKKLGLSISVDDFGTEYSSLSRLKEMPVDRLKIDRQFVQGLTTNPKDKAITSIITSLSKNLEIGSTAEGVETLEQLEHLRQLECDEAQGFYFYKPLPASEAEHYILADFSEELLSVDI